MDRRTVTAMTVGTLGVITAAAIAGISVYQVAAHSTTQAPPIAPTPFTPAPLLDPPGTERPLPALPVVVDITADAATAMVLAAAPGVAMQTVGTSEAGVASWAVQVQRTDGSVVTGYVDRGTGVIHSWTLDTAAPAAKGGYQDDEYETDEYETDEYETDEHEGDDD